jgi:hypothetical protein
VLHKIKERDVENLISLFLLRCMFTSSASHANVVGKSLKRHLKKGIIEHFFTKVYKQHTRKPFSSVLDDNPIFYSSIIHTSFEDIHM